jgi:hypothetical protein
VRPFPLFLALLALLGSLLHPTPLRASDAGVFPYIPSPHAFAEPAVPGELFQVNVDVYGTLDAAELVTVTLDLDPRLQVQRYAAVATAVEGGRAKCSGAGPVICTVPVKRWQPAGMVVEVLLPGGVWPCEPLQLVATAATAELTSTVTRERTITGAEACTTTALPYIGGS